MHGSGSVNQKDQLGLLLIQLKTWNQGHHGRYRIFHFFNQDNRCTLVFAIDQDNQITIHHISETIQSGSGMELAIDLSLHFRFQVMRWTDDFLDFALQVGVNVDDQWSFGFVRIVSQFGNFLGGRTIVGGRNVPWRNGGRHGQPHVLVFDGQFHDVSQLDLSSSTRFQLSKFHTENVRCGFVKQNGGIALTHGLVIFSFGFFFVFDNGFNFCPVNGSFKSDDGRRFFHRI